MGSPGTLTFQVENPGTLWGPAFNVPVVASGPPPPQTISPTAALSSFPYAPREAMRALRHFLTKYGERVWGEYGFTDAFCESKNWYPQTVLAIDQGPIILMIENYRTGLLWKLFMSVPELQLGLRRLGLSSPHLRKRTRG